MKKFLLIVIAAFMTSGCAASDWFGGLFSGSDSGGRVSGGGNVSQKQMAAARESFDRKIQAVPGQTLAQVQREWGRLEAGLSRDGLTVYTWRQTARITDPNPKVVQASQGSAKGETASCLAMFIVNPNQVVMDATSEGLCLDLYKMPAWRPHITEATDGRLGPI